MSCWMTCWKKFCQVALSFHCSWSISVGTPIHPKDALIVAACGRICTASRRMHSLRRMDEISLQTQRLRRRLLWCLGARIDWRYRTYGSTRGNRYLYVLGTTGDHGFREIRNLDALRDVVVARWDNLSTNQNPAKTKKARVDLPR